VLGCSCMCFSRIHFWPPFPSIVSAASIFLRSFVFCALGLHWISVTGRVSVSRCQDPVPPRLFFSCSKLSVPPGARADFSFSLCAGSSCSRSSDARSIRSCRPKFSAPGPFLVAARFPALLARRVSRRRYSFVARGFVSARLEPRRAPLLISPSCSCSLLVDASGLAAGAA
jgi:hypothetical protein